MNGPILGIETTCDETSAAVLDAQGTIRGLVIHSQDVHRVYGGVIPELAARDHLRRIEPVVAAALREAGIRRRDLAAIAVAVGPGLIGALLVGVSWARAAAFALGIPLVPVHHMEGHLFGPVLEDPDAVPPFVALLVSGGHTMLLWVPEWGRYFLLGQTRDDAAGEAFDKVARVMGLPYPGGARDRSGGGFGRPAAVRVPAATAERGSCGNETRARAFRPSPPPGGERLRLFLLGPQDGGRPHGGGAGARTISGCATGGHVRQRDGARRVPGPRGRGAPPSRRLFPGGRG